MAMAVARLDAEDAGGISTVCLSSLSQLSIATALIAGIPRLTVIFRRDLAASQPNQMAARDWLLLPLCSVIISTASFSLAQKAMLC